MPRLKTREEIIITALAVPSLLGLLIFFIVPFGYSLYLAVIDNPVARNFVWFDNFIATFNNSAFKLAMRNTLTFMALSVPFNLVLPLLLAAVLKNFKHKEILGMLFVLPLVVPSGAMVHFWHNLFGINGAVNGLFFRDSPINWLGSDLSLVVILIIFMWKNAGFNIVLYQAGLNLIPSEYYEFAAVEGAGLFKKFRHITAIYLAPTFFMVMLMSVLATFRSFREIYLLSGAHPHSRIYMLQHFMNNMFNSLNYQRLATAAYFLAAGIVIFAAGSMFLLRRVTRHE
ncbi:MAG: sugar ABC transporter permease [Clostridiales bacterium]|jgi:multiple sugar transport system permease protein|nr:sugar ABC transporter permease [Clostridiales bacterium]